MNKIENELPINTMYLFIVVVLMVFILGYLVGAVSQYKNTVPISDVVEHGCAKYLYPESDVLIWADNGTRSDGK